MDHKLSLIVATKIQHFLENFSVFDCSGLVQGENAEKKKKKLTNKMGCRNKEWSVEIKNGV